MLDIDVSETELGGVWGGEGSIESDDPRIWGEIYASGLYDGGETAGCLNTCAQWVSSEQWAVHENWRQHSRGEGNKKKGWRTK